MSAVRFAPLVAGSVAGNLPFGIVPEPRFDAFNEVNPIPEPLNDVAVTIPDIVAPVALMRNLSLPAVSIETVSFSGNPIFVSSSPL